VPSPSSSHRAAARDPLAWATTLLGLAAFAACLIAWRASTGAAPPVLDVPWAPALDLRLHFAFDGIGALYGLLATGIGAVVFAYATAYLPLHLEHVGKRSAERWRFWPWMGLFAAAMVGLATAQDLIVLFVLFDVTAVCSYFLIGFDKEQRATRLAALMALLVTGVGAVALLVGAAILFAHRGTFQLPELGRLIQDGGEADTLTTVAAALIALAALAKSAQVPLHFWLPRAMAAPTPVSAYLHSAAMVAAGVLVIGRTYPILSASQVVLDGLLVVGLASIAIGGAIALTRDGFKQVLAYSTISQYGYVVTLYGVGGRAGAGAAAFYVVAHAVAKSALFLTAGAVTMATGARTLSQVGGLLRSMPALALASGLAAATLSALPLTIGFFKDELFFRATAHHSTALGVAAVLAAGLTFAYTWRFWGGLFLGPRRAQAGPIPPLLVAPIALLALVALTGGLVAGPFSELASDAATATLAAPAAVEVAYHLDTRDENLMALGAWAIGALLLLTPRAWGPAARALARAGEAIGPARVYEQSLHLLNAASDTLHDVEVRDLRSRVVSVLLPGGLLVALGFAATPTAGAFALGGVDGTDLLVVAMLALVAVAAIVVTTARHHVALVLALSVVGLGLSVVYALLGAPDVALVAVLVETVVMIVFLAIVAYAPRARRGPRAIPPTAGELKRSHRWRDPLIGAIAGGTAFLVVWASLSRPAATERVVNRQVDLTPAAHGQDVVTVILADFRGLDTLVEVTVIGVATFGVVALLRKGRTW
jgi:multicomponent Na+:H+ antiporter subunit A